MPKEKSAKQKSTLITTNMSGSFCIRHSEGATPSPHQAGCHLWARNQLQLLLPQGLQLGPLQSHHQGKRHGKRGPTNLYLHGRLPHGILLAWWMKPFLFRTSSTPSPPTYTWQPSAKYCLSHRPGGRPGSPTSPRRKQAATPGAKAVVRFELRCHHLCLRQGAPYPVLPVLQVTGLCPGIGSLRGLGRGPIRAPRRPTLSARDPQDSKYTSLCTPATLGVGSGRVQINMIELLHTGSNQVLIQNYSYELLSSSFVPKMSLLFLAIAFFFFFSNEIFA